MQEKESTERVQQLERELSAERAALSSAKATVEQRGTELAATAARLASTETARLALETSLAQLQQTAAATDAEVLSRPRAVLLVADVSPAVCVTVVCGIVPGGAVQLRRTSSEEKRLEAALQESDRKLQELR